MGFEFFIAVFNSLVISKFFCSFKVNTFVVYPPSKLHIQLLIDPKERLKLIRLHTNTDNHNAGGFWCALKNLLNDPWNANAFEDDASGAAQKAVSAAQKAVPGTTSVRAQSSGCTGA